MKMPFVSRKAFDAQRAGFVARLSAALEKQERSIAEGVKAEKERLDGLFEILTRVNLHSMDMDRDDYDQPYSLIFSIPRHLFMEGNINQHIDIADMVARNIAGRVRRGLFDLMGGKSI